MEYHVLIPFFVITALVLASELSGVTADEIGGLVGHWNFDDGTGADLSGNGNHAVLGGAKIYSLGEGRACIETMPKTEPMRIPVHENSPLALSRGTICFWLNTISDRSNILRYNNDAVELNTYRGCFQVRFRGEKVFEYWEGDPRLRLAPLRHARMGVLSARESLHWRFRMASVRCCL